MLELLRKNKGRRNKIRYLVSTAGLPNYGDELITRGWVSYLAKQCPNDEVWLDCSNPSHASLLFQGLHPRLHCVNTLWQLVWNATPLIDDMKEAIQQVEHWIECGGTPREDYGIDILKRAYSIHLLGGGYVNSMWRANTLLVHAVSALHKIVPQVRLFCTGLGLFPLSEVDAQNLKECFKNFEYADARDSASAESVGIRLGNDDVFLPLALGLPKQEKIGDGVFICLQQDVVGRRDEMVDVAIECLRQSDVGDGIPLYLIEAIPPDDSWSLSLFRDKWSGHVEIIPFTRLWSSGFPVSDNAIYVSSRFHIHLVAAALGAKGIVLDYKNDYYDNKHSSLFSLGTGWGNAGPGEASSASVDSLFLEKADRLKRQKLKLAQELYAK